MATGGQRSSRLDDIDVSHPEPLPDLPRHPNMQRAEQTYMFRALLSQHLADRDDVLISGGGYLRHHASN